MTESYDVLIIGGGVAGTSAGITLLKKPEMRVAVLEKGDYTQFKPGESLSPGVRGLLDYLNVWDTFKAEQPMESFGSQAAWGHEEAATLDFLFTVHGSGWSLDRLGFEQLLAKTLEDRGGTLLKNSGFLSAKRLQDGWQITYQDNAGQTKTLKSQFVIDASGRNGLFAKKIGAVRQVSDRLVGVSAVATVPEDAKLAQSVLVEACEYGWWYSAPIPGNKAVVVLMSDSDLINQRSLNRFEDWLAALQDMPLTNERTESLGFDESLRLTPAFSSILDQSENDDWLAVGDAAVSHDPLSSSGIPHAMGSGVQGAIVAVNSMNGGQEALGAFHTSLKEDFRQYGKTHWKYYNLEKRWPDAVFWQRRNTFVQLDPNSEISQTLVSADLNFELVHLTKRDMLDLLSHCQPDSKVYEIVRKFTEMHPRLMDQQVILGLQELVAQGKVILKSVEAPLPA